MKETEINNLYRRDVHEQWAEAKTMEHSSGIWGREPMLECLQETIQPGEIVIDLGSGAGYPSAKIAEMVGESGKVIGVERSQAMLGLEAGQDPLSNRYADIPNLEFINADITKLPLESHIADKIVSFMVLHNLTIEQVQDTLKETARTLKSDGKAVFLSMHPRALEKRWDLDFIQYNHQDLDQYEAAEDKEGIEVHGLVKNVGGGEKEVLMISHTRENMEVAIKEAGLQIILEKDLWIDEDTAKEKFGDESVKRLPETPTFWMVVLESATENT
ncbi:MAG: class I SAM-dependent methyltransferase [Candidatus Buchananbacteria bacterium]|nr:class I SAM-dependent methyltransferase [Candidatus Buchananbacteria bacterium]